MQDAALSLRFLPLSSGKTQIVPTDEIRPMGKSTETGILGVVLAAR